MALFVLSAGVMLVQVSHSVNPSTILTNRVRRTPLKHYITYSIQLHSVGEGSEAASASTHDSKPDRGGESSGRLDLRVYGMCCVLGACLTSGAAGVFFEFLVKSSQQKSVIVRNLQLGEQKLLL